MVTGATFASRAASLTGMRSGAAVARVPIRSAYQSDKQPREGATIRGAGRRESRPACAGRVRRRGSMIPRRPRPSSGPSAADAMMRADSGVARASGAEIIEQELWAMRPTEEIAQARRQVRADYCALWDRIRACKTLAEEAELRRALPEIKSRVE